MGSDNELLFTAVDPCGRIVVCLRSQWKKHIIIGHPEVEDSAPQVELTLIDPDIIVKSNEYGTRDVYFKQLNSDDEHMKVVVEISQNYGEVVTAFPRRGVRGNIDMEVVRYVRPKL